MNGDIVAAAPAQPKPRDQSPFFGWQPCMAQNALVYRYSCDFITPRPALPMPRARAPS